MLSSNIAFCGADGHTIYDLESGEVLNRTRPSASGIMSGLGSGATFVKGCSVDANTVFATMSLVGRSFSEENIAIAGNSAIFVKRNVRWERSYIQSP